MPAISQPPPDHPQRLGSRLSAAAVEALCFAILIALGGCCMAGSVIVAAARALAGQRAASPGASGRLQPAGWRGQGTAAFTNGAGPTGA